MIYGPDDKPIIPEYAKGLRTLTKVFYKKSLLKRLESKFRFSDWWGPGRTPSLRQSDNHLKNAAG